MIRRLLTYLLVACLAIPAMAAPLHCEVQAPQMAAMHDMVMMQDHAHHHGQAPRHKAPDLPATAHDCIGCIAPLAGIGPVSGPGLLPVVPLISREAMLIVRHTSGPDTPPPRA